MVAERGEAVHPATEATASLGSETAAQIYKLTLTEANPFRVAAGKN